MSDTLDADAVYDAHPSMFRNHPFGFILSVILIAALGLGIIILLWWYLQTRATRLRLSGRDIHLERGLLNKEHIDLDISQVRSVRVKQSLINRMLSTGKIEVFTTGDNPEFTVTGMPDPNFVRDFIRARMRGDQDQGG